MSTPSDEHRRVAAYFTALARNTPADRWDAPSPVAQWRARDVVGHLVSWLADFLESGADVRLPPGPSVEDDPVAAWEHHVAAVQALLDDPASRHRTLTNPHVGSLPVDEAVDRFYTGDVFLHSWDLGRATGQEVTLDPERCAAMLAGMEPLDDLLRQSGEYGPRVPMPDDAPVQDRLIGFIGRDPAWRG
jgi:uncharacterized protein (TIGR03086 family)